MAKFILDGQEYGGGGSGSNIVKLTQAEYDALSNDKLSNDTIYLITDSGELAAENLFYDGSQTGLGNNVQDAIDELNSNIDEQNKKLRDIIIIKNRNYNITPTTEKSVIEFEYDLTDLIPSGYKSIFLMSSINYTDGHGYQQAIIADDNSHTNPKGIGRIYCEKKVGVNVCISLICLKIL